MRVSLQRKERPGAPEETGPASALLEAGGARVVLGGRPGADGLAEPVAPAADTLFGPRGATLAAPGGPLFVCDTGHYRLLIWKEAPLSDHAAADLVIGQPDFVSEGRNARGPVGAATFNVPTGIAASDEALAVADAWNHRVLIWFGRPERSNQPADVVLGQVDFAHGVANRGGDRARVDTLNWCYGVAICDGALYVADAGNRRVLRWDRIPWENGAPADLVLGETDFDTRDENAGHGVDAVGMRWPHDVCIASGRLFVADAGNNRVMVWNKPPVCDGAPCDAVLGQANFAGNDHNRAAYYPTAGALNMPYAVTTLGERLVVADTANSRLVGYRPGDVGIGASASFLAGQPSFSDKGDNRWHPPVRDSLCWPYGVSGCGRTLVVADSGNNRVMLWQSAA